MYLENIRTTVCTRARGNVDDVIGHYAAVPLKVLPHAARIPTNKGSPERTRTPPSQRTHTVPPSSHAGQYRHLIIRAYALHSVPSRDCSAPAGFCSLLSSPSLSLSLLLSSLYPLPTPPFGWGFRCSDHNASVQRSCVRRYDQVPSDAVTTVPVCP